MNVKNILLFVSGLVVGGVSGIFGSKWYFQKKYQKQYEEDHDALEEYYKRTDEYYRVDHDEEEDEFEDDGVNSPEGESVPGGRMNSEERSEIKKKLNQQYGMPTDYASMYKNVEHNDKSMYDTEVKLAEAEHPVDSDEDDFPPICHFCKYMIDQNPADCTGRCQLHGDGVNNEDSCSDFMEIGESTPEEEAFDEHQKNMNRPPKIISSDLYENLPAYIEKEVLHFYAYDEMLCDENDDPVDEPERLIGDALTKYGFIDNEEQIIFVMNYAIDTCYEIQKIDSSWTDSH